MAQRCHQCGKTERQQGSACICSLFKNQIDWIKGQKEMNIYEIALNDLTADLQFVDKSELGDWAAANYETIRNALKIAANTSFHTRYPVLEIT